MIDNGLVIFGLIHLIIEIVLLHAMIYWGCCQDEAEAQQPS
jgi:hypothetical protein